MTLERHKSHLIPDVECTPEGIFVTDRDGSFALRGKRSGRTTPPADYDTYRSYDSARKQRAYKPRPLSHFSQESNNNTLTSSAASTMNSLGRKLRRSKSARGRLSDEKRFGSMGRSTVSSGGGTQRLRGGTPQMSAEMSASLSRAKKARSLDLSFKRKSDSGSFLRNGSTTFPLSAALTDIVLPQAKRITEQRLPGMFFVVDGLLLMLLGFIRMFVSWWHVYYCALWSGALVLLLGILGVTHRGDYLTKWKNGSYIAAGVLAACAVMGSTALSLAVIVPLLKNTVSSVNGTRVADLVDFTNMNGTATSTAVSADATVYATLALELCIMIMLLFNFFTLTAALMAVCNHWDAVYTSTGQCDFRGTPRFFNPLEQISLGQASLFLGILCLSVLTADTNVYFSPIWTAILVIAGGVCSMFHLRRVDVKWLGYVALFIQVCGILACAAALTFVALALVDDVEQIYTNSPITRRERGERITSICGEITYLIGMVVNIVFTSGILFRQSRIVCCQSCTSDNSTI
ncbi:hypothetical protein NP493_12g04008 [Ridgeia piscesae]|uniref:Uncharacterized protein n=1 Tax=Ridgeia piscesae TaxID=27915 RepID=A0AAD9PET9_RIDPI|nr:hypothetical protein NP493_12g04008 [Ridgeia piscesae]